MCVLRIEVTETKGSERSIAECKGQRVKSPKKKKWFLLLWDLAETVMCEMS